MKTYDPMAGEHISDAARAMVDLANRSGESVTAMFNEIPVNAVPGGDYAGIVSYYNAEMERRRTEYEASPEYAKHQR